MKKLIEELIVELNPFDDISNDTDLLEEGLLDSLSIIGLISSFEKKTGARLPQEMITIENFTSVASIVKSLKKCGIYRDL